jgi:DNA adenine methylase
MGAKARLAPWIISFMPDHAAYCEPFGGSAVVLLNKRPANHEVYNDLDEQLTRFFRVLQSPLRSGKLLRRLGATPFSRNEFERALRAVERPRDEVDHAWGVFCSAWFTRPGDRSNFFSAPTDGNGRVISPGRTFARAKANLRDVIRRIENVVIENQCALDVIRQYDSERMLFYVDPPYPGEKGYKCKVVHVELIDLLNSIRGSYILSSYANHDYSALNYVFSETKREMNFAGRFKDEILYMNFKSPQPGLFGPDRRSGSR